MGKLVTVYLVIPHPNPSLAPAPGTVPRAPGVYRFETFDGRPLYVGKAKNLEKRVANYFSDSNKLHPRTLQMLAQAEHLRWIICSTEAEALILERSWIAREQPRFNVKLRDGDGYSGLTIDLSKNVPRLHSWRGRRPIGEVFGPYPGARARDLIDALTRAFGVRSCKDDIYRRAQKNKRACLLADIGRCSAPCVGLVSIDEHLNRSKDLVKFLAGEDRTLIDKLHSQMNEAANNLQFELATIKRDELDGLRQVLTHQAIVTGVKDCDCVALDFAEELVGISVISVRNGEVRGVVTFVADRDPLLSTDEHWTQLTIRSLENVNLSDKVLLAGTSVIPKALSLALSAQSSRTITVRKPRTEEAGVAGMAIRNAAEVLANGSIRRSTSMDNLTVALSEIKSAIGMECLPWRIECLDISHTQGKYPVASVVVLEDGFTKSSQYRRVNVSNDFAGDDPRSLAYTLRRRFTGNQLGLDRIPDLIIVDGGPLQVAAAASSLNEIWANSSQNTKPPSVIGIAKRLEEIWLPDEEWPVILERNSPGLLILQLARDEAHRTAIEFHRRQRDRRALTVKLDMIPGLGSVKKRALIERFGNIDGVIRATEQELITVPGIGTVLASVIYNYLNKYDV